VLANADNLVCDYSSISIISYFHGGTSLVVPPSISYFHQSLIVTVKMLLNLMNRCHRWRNFWSLKTLLGECW